MSDSVRLNQARYAVLKKVSRARVTQWKAAGLVILDEGLVDVNASDAMLASRPDVYRGGGKREGVKQKTGLGIAKDDHPRRDLGRYCSMKDQVRAKTRQVLDRSFDEIAAVPDWTLAEAVRQKEISLALLRQIEYEREVRQLVTIEVIGREVEARYALVRQKLLTIPGNIAEHIVGQNVAQIEADLQTEIVEALDALEDPDVS